MIGTAAALLGSAALGAGSSIFGAMSAKSAASAQADAAAQANAIMQSHYHDAERALSPFYTAGADYSGQLQKMMPFLTSPIVMDQATLEQTPGYQFNLSQGLRGAQNALTAAGLGNSGAAAKAASRFATGLADNTYQTQFNLENINRTNAYNRLLGPIQIGANAASAFAGNAINAGNVQSQNTIGAGNAAAAGTMAGANYLNQGANNIGSNLLLSSLLGRGNSGGGMYGNAADAGLSGGVGTGGFNFLDALAG